MIKVTDVKVDLSNRMIFDMLKVPIERAMNHLGEKGIKEVQELISVPVEIDPVTGMMIRSAPFEPPRKETGELFNNVNKHVQVNAENMEVVLTIVSERPSTPEAPHVLEYGGGAWEIAPRPYMSVAFQKIKEYALQTISSALSSKSKL